LPGLGSLGELEVGWAEPAPPASKRTFGWAVDVKARWLRLGVERNNRYDFTRVDNDIFTVGFEVVLPKPQE